MAFGQVLVDQSVGVFVGPALPSVVRSGEVELHFAAQLDLRVPMKLGAVVGGDRTEFTLVPAHEHEGDAAGLGDRARLELADEGVPALALDQSQDAATALAQAGSHRRVDLPVAEAPARFDGGGSLANQAFTGQAAVTIDAPGPLEGMTDMSWVKVIGKVNFRPLGEGKMSAVVQAERILPTNPPAEIMLY